MSLLAVPRKLRGSVVICPGCKNRCRVPSQISTEPPPLLPDSAEVALYDAPTHNWTRTTLVASMAAAIVAVGGLVLNRALDHRIELPPEAAVSVLSEPAATQVAAKATNDPDVVPQLAAQARQILEKHCHRCHGLEGVAEGGFNFVLRRDRLVAGNHYITPGSADRSFLLERIVDKEMPPDGEGALSPEETETLRRWVNAGAADFDAPLVRDFISNADLVRFIRQDLEQMPERQHRHSRYFTLTNLHNAGYSQDEMQTYRLALSKLINSLSWHKKIVHPESIDPARTIYRIDVRTLGWDDAVWEKVIAANPYSVKLDVEERDGKFCLEATDCQVPHVRADWFVAAASRPPLYHQVLQLPETLDELLDKRFPEIDLQKDILQESVARVGMSKSGVSQNNRLIEWHRASTGYLWISYDFAGNTGRKNLFQHPLGPGSEGKHFQHDGGEIIFSLPNGLQGYMLVDAQNKRLDKAPTTIVTDPKRPDSAVTNGVSCMSCHYGGVIAKTDEVRRNVEINRTSFRDDGDAILALYPPRQDLDKLFAENAEQFCRAIEEVGVRPISETNEPIVNMALRFEADVDLLVAAAELGLTPQDFASRLKGNPRVQDRLGPLNVDGGTVKRELFAKEFTFVVEEFRLGTALVAADEKDETAQPVKVADVLAKQLENVEQTAESQAGTPVTPKNDASIAPVPADTPAAGMRKWTDHTGERQVDGELIDQFDRDVALRLSDGVMFLVPLDELSAADQKFVASELAKRQRTEPPPGEVLAPQQPTSKIALPVARPPQAQYRPWTNITRGEMIEAAFVYLRNGNLKLEDKRYRGVFHVWPMSEMSLEDHAFVRSELGTEEYDRHRRSPPRSNAPFRLFYLP
jgi:mono/diheme cytochrome c family protein